MTEGTKSIEAYINNFEGETKLKLNEIRVLIATLIPDATEKISYGIPTYFLKENIVHYAGYKNHIGFYPGSKAIECFTEIIKPYKSSKGAIQFPINKELPIELITKIVQYRLHCTK